LLIKSHLRLVETKGEQVNSRRMLPPEIAPLYVFGQEINPATFAIARMNTFIHDIDAEESTALRHQQPRGSRSTPRGSARR
jgi:type I restriction enzyme M protein